MKKTTSTRVFVTLSILPLLCTGAFAQNGGQQVGEMMLQGGDGTLHKKRGYSPYAGRSFPARPFWGDTHLHTNLSLDARAFGVTIGVEEAYRLARGEEVIATHGEPVKLSRPLDFLVVADHSDAMGAMRDIFQGNPDLLADPTVRDWYRRLQEGGKTADETIFEIVNGMTQGTLPEVLVSESFMRTIWDENLELAEQFNDPGRFTAMIGYEWTSTPDGRNLHRNVLYRDGADLARQMLPFTADQSLNPEDLWKWMAAYEEKTGGRVLTLAHNGNWSNGMMFPVETNPATGEPLGADYMKERIRWEPLYEVTQIKGDGETHALLSPTDEFADFDTMGCGQPQFFRGQDRRHAYNTSTPARAGIKNGLELEAKFGTEWVLTSSAWSARQTPTRPWRRWKNRASSASTPTNEPSAERAAGHPRAQSGDIVYWAWALSASGYAAVWATENTREATLRRHGMRASRPTPPPGPAWSCPVLRWMGFRGNGCRQSSAQHRMSATSKGVPMGGDLFRTPAR